MSLSKYKNVHRGERCVLMGNGPSLTRTDWSLLKGERVIGLNKIFLLFDKTEIRPDYVVSYIPNVVEQNKDQFEALEMPLFLAAACRDMFEGSQKSDLYYFGSHCRYLFSTDPADRICSGATVTYVALQLLYYMGFSKVILTGVDFRFKYSGPPDAWFRIKDQDPNHFDPRYFDKGQLWQAPNLSKQIVHYSMAKLAYEADGREIVDATDGGALEVFRKTSLVEALSETVLPPVVFYEESSGEENSLLYEKSSGPEGFGARCQVLLATEAFPLVERVCVVYSDRNYGAMSELREQIPDAQFTVLVPQGISCDFTEYGSDEYFETIPQEGNLDADTIDARWLESVANRGFQLIIYTCQSHGLRNNVEALCDRLRREDESVPVFGYIGGGKVMRSRSV